MTKEKFKNIFNVAGSALMLSSVFAMAVAVAAPVTATTAAIAGGLIVTGLALMSGALHIQSQQEKDMRAQSGQENHRVTRNQSTRLPAHQTSLP